MTLHETKLKSLKNVLVGCLGYDWDELDNYDMTQPDDMDESGSGGAWDLAGAIADNVFHCPHGRQWRLGIMRKRELLHL